MAEVVVTRGTRGSNCGNCEAAYFQSELKTPRITSLTRQLREGESIQSKSSKIFGAALGVYPADE